MWNRRLEMAVKTAPRIIEKSAEIIPTHFPSLNAGLEYIADSWPTLHRKALAEIRGLFSKDELLLILHVFNGCALTPALAGKHLAPSVVDGIALQGLDKKWHANSKKMVHKIDRLTSFQAAAIEVWATGFWVGSANRNKGAIEEYVKDLV
jgi:hypothetical protein